MSSSLSPLTSVLEIKGLHEGRPEVPRPRNDTERCVPMSRAGRPGGVPRQVQGNPGRGDKVRDPEVVEDDYRDVGRVWKRGPDLEVI